MSVDGAAVTLVSDCVPQLPVLSPGRRLISTAGLTVLGTRNPREKAFEVWGTEGHLSQPESRDLVMGHRAGLSSWGSKQNGGGCEIYSMMRWMTPHYVMVEDGEWWGVAVEGQFLGVGGPVTAPQCKTTRPRYSFYMSPNFHRDPRS